MSGAARGSGVAATSPLVANAFVLEFVVNIRWLLHYATRRLDPTVDTHYPQFMADVTELDAVLSEACYAHVQSIGELPYGLLKTVSEAVLYLLISDHMLGGCPPTMHPFLLRIAAARDRDLSTTEESSSIEKKGEKLYSGIGSARTPRRRGSGAALADLNTSEHSASPSSHVDTRPLSSISDPTIFAVDAHRDTSSPPAQAMMILLRWLLIEGLLDVEELASTLEIALPECVRQGSNELSMQDRRQFLFHQQLACLLAQVVPLYLGGHVLLSRSLLLQHCGGLLTVSHIRNHLRHLQGTGEAKQGTAAHSQGDDGSCTVDEALVEWLVGVVSILVQRDATCKTDGHGPSLLDQVRRDCPPLSAFVEVGPLSSVSEPSSRQSLFDVTRSGECLALALLFYAPQELPLQELTSQLSRAPEDAILYLGGREAFKAYCYWSFILTAASNMGLWAGFTTMEMIRNGATALPLHLFRFTAELFAFLATTAEEDVRVSVDTAWWEDFTNSDLQLSRDPAKGPEPESQQLLRQSMLSSGSASLRQSPQRRVAQEVLHTPGGPTSIGTLKGREKDYRSITTLASLENLSAYPSQTDTSATTFQERWPTATTAATKQFARGEVSSPLRPADSFSADVTASFAAMEAGVEVAGKLGAPAELPGATCVSDEEVKPLRPMVRRQVIRTVKQPQPEPNDALELPDSGRYLIDLYVHASDPVDPYADDSAVVSGREAAVFPVTPLGPLAGDAQRLGSASPTSPRTGRAAAALLEGGQRRTQAIQKSATRQANTQTTQSKSDASSWASRDAAELWSAKPQKLSTTPLPTSRSSSARPTLHGASRVPIYDLPTVVLGKRKKRTESTHRTNGTPAEINSEGPCRTELTLFSSPAAGPHRLATTPLVEVVPAPSPLSAAPSMHPETLTGVLQGDAADQAVPTVAVPYPTQREKEKAVSSSLSLTTTSTSSFSSSTFLHKDVVAPAAVHPVEVCQNDSSIVENLGNSTPPRLGASPIPATLQEWTTADQSPVTPKSGTAVPPRREKIDKDNATVEASWISSSSSLHYTPEVRPLCPPPRLPFLLSPRLEVREKADDAAAELAAQSLHEAEMVSHSLPCSGAPTQLESASEVFGSSFSSMVDGLLASETEVVRRRQLHWDEESFFSSASKCQGQSLRSTQTSKNRLGSSVAMARLYDIINHLPSVNLSTLKSSASDPLYKELVMQQQMVEQLKAAVVDMRSAGSSSPRLSFPSHQYVDRGAPISLEHELVSQTKNSVEKSQRAPVVQSSPSDP